MRSLATLLTAKGFLNHTREWFVRNFVWHDGLVTAERCVWTPTLAEALSMARDDSEVRAMLQTVLTKGANPEEVLAKIGALAAPEEPCVLERRIRAQKGTKRKLACQAERARREGAQMEKFYKCLTEPPVSHPRCQVVSMSPAPICDVQDPVPEDPVEPIGLHNTALWRGKQPSLTISKKLEIIGFMEKLPLEVTSKERVTMTMFPESLRAQGTLGRWRKAAARDRWRQLPKEIASTSKEPPNWWRSCAGLALRKGHRLDRLIPMELQVDFDKVLVSRIHGLPSHAKQSINEALRPVNLVKGMNTLITRFNMRVRKSNEEISHLNKQTWTKYQKGKISGEEARNNLLEPKRLAMGKPSSVWAKRFLDRFRWRGRAISAPAEYLPYNHWRLNAFRKQFREELAFHGVEQRLVLNYDQVWRIRYRGGKAQLWKQKALAGSFVDDVERHPKRLRSLMAMQDSESVGRVSRWGAGVGGWVGAVVSMFGWTGGLGQ